MYYVLCTMYSVLCNPLRTIQLYFSGEEYNITVTVKSSEDYPLDVYYLMDFSFSMKGDLAELQSLTENISKFKILVSLKYFGEVT